LSSASLMGMVLLHFHKACKQSAFAFSCIFVDFQRLFHVSKIMLTFNYVVLKEKEQVPTPGSPRRALRI
jgi:hypothetical protein